jgi:hypothetical protein
MVRPDQLQLTALISRKGNTGEVWKGTLWGKQVHIGFRGSMSVPSGISPDTALALHFVAYD